jgi:hypothetical protein
MDWWITLGDTCYGPDWVPLPLENSYFYRGMIAHEQVHSDRQLEWMKTKPLWLYLLLYGLFPVPLFFAWFRWREERIACLEDLKAGASIDEVVEEIWSHWWPWPRFLMRRWFENNARQNKEGTRPIP